MLLILPQESADPLPSDPDRRIRITVITSR